MPKLSIVGTDTEPETYFEPLGNSVIIKPIDLAEQTKGGVFLPGNGKPEASADFRRATVIAVGPGVHNDSGQRIPLDVKPGDVVLYSHPGSASLDNIGGKQTGLRILTVQIIACIERTVKP